MCWDAAEPPEVSDPAEQVFQYHLPPDRNRSAWFVSLSSLLISNWVLLLLLPKGEWSISLAASFRDFLQLNKSLLSAIKGQEAVLISCLQTNTGQDPRCDHGFQIQWLQQEHLSMKHLVLK